MWSDNETATYLLVFQYLTKAVCGIVKNEHLLPATIGVSVDWGGGKSSLIQMATAELEKDDDIILFQGTGRCQRHDLTRLCDYCVSGFSRELAVPPEARFAL